MILFFCSVFFTRIPTLIIKLIIIIIIQGFIKRISTMTNALYNLKLQIIKTHLKAKSIQITHAIKTYTIGKQLHLQY